MEDLGQRILLIDKNEDDYIFFRDLLSQGENSKFELNRMTTYETALAAITSCQYALYLIEYDLDDHTGLELLAEARRQGCQAPIILLSQENDRRIDLAAMQAGASDYLVKEQLDAPRLERSIRYALERKRVAGERNKQLAVERTQRRFAEALSDITIALNSTLNLAELLARILVNIKRVVPHEAADIMLLEAEMVRVVSSWGYIEQHELPVQDMRFALDYLPTLRQMVETGQPLLISNTYEDSKWIDIPETRWVRSYVGAPILVKAEIVGFLNLASTTPNFFQPAHAERLIAFANQAGIALGNAQLLEAERKQRELAETLQEVSIVLNSTLAFDTVLDRLLEQIARVVPYDSGNLMLVEEGRIHISRSRGYEHFGSDTVQTVRSMTFNIAETRNLRHIIETKQPLVISNTATYGHWVKTESMEHIRSWIGAPIVVQGEVIALFSLDKTEPGFYQPEHAELLSLFAHQVAPALENAWSFEAEARRRHEAETLRRTTAALTSALDLDQVLESILLQLAQVVPYDSTCLFLKEADQMRAMAGRGLPNPDRVIGRSYPLVDDFLFAEMQRTHRPIYISDAQADPRFLGWGGATYVRGWLGVPLIARGEVIGHLTLDSHQYGAYGDTEAAVAQAFANQAAAAIENARLFQAVQKARQLSDTLRAIGASMTATLNLDEVLNRILDGLGQLVPYSSASVWLVDNDVIYVKAGRGFPDDSPLRSLSLTLDEKILAYEMFKNKKPLFVPDIYQEPRWVKAEGDEHIRAWLGVPLFVRDKPVGFLGVDHRQPGYYTEEHVAIITAFAQQAVVAIENARLFETAERKVAELDAVRKASLGLISSLELQTVLETILENTLNLMAGVHNTNIFLYQAGKLIFGAALSVDGRSAEPFAEPRSDGLTYTVARQGKPIIVPDMQTHPLFRNAPPEWIGSIISLPLKIGRRVVGVMNVADKQARPWSEAEIHILHLLADQAAVAIENARLFEAEHAAREQSEQLKEETHKNLAQITRLYELSTEIVSALSLETAANLVMEKVVQATGAHSAILNLLDQAGNLELAIGPSESPPRTLGTTKTIFETGQPLIVSDVALEPQLFPPDLQEKGIRASIGLPLKAGRQIIGVLFVRFDQPHRFSQRELETLFIFASQAAIAIQNAHLYEQVKQHATELREKVAERTFELRVMYELAQALGQATQLGDVIRLILLHLYQAIPYDLAACLLATGPTCRLVIQSQYPYSSRLETDIKEITSSILVRLDNQKCSALHLDIHRIQPQHDDRTVQTRLESLGSLLQVAITIEAAPVGILLIGAQQVGQFGPEQANLLRTVADQAAESIRRLQSFLAAEHRRLDNLVAQLPNGVILLDKDQRIILANPMGQEFLNVTAGVAPGHTLTYLGQKPIKEVLALNSVGNHFEIKTTGWPGYIFEVTAKPIEAGPELGGGLLVIRDITAERAAQQRLQQQEQLAAVGQLAAGIAHDFNNILTSIIGYAELVQLEAELPNRTRQDVERIANQGHRAARLVRQILDFSRQSITEKRPLDLALVVKEVIKLLERTIPENIQIILQIEPQDKGYPIIADLAQMQQVLTNLAINARDAMPNGGIMRLDLSHLSPKSGVRPPHPEMSTGNWIVLAISDTGIGIPPEDHPHIFEPFFTTKETGQGTGLGLAQVYGIMTEHKGYVDVDSLVGEGTTFTCYLPAQPAVIRPSPPVIPSAIPRGEGETILLVEDDVEVLNITKAMLVSLGYQVLVATNGQNAWEIYEQHQQEIGLVLTDLTMPDMDGAALARLLCQRNPTVKIVALTGYPLEANRQAKAWPAQGIVDWLQKPVTLEQLGQTISRFLRNES